TDLLLHDMGPGLADTLGEGQATGSEWRTPPLWGLGLSACVTGGVAGTPAGSPFGVDGNERCTPRHSYLHDGRARSIEEAILWHGGEGESSKQAFQNLPAVEKSALLRFLRSL
ncbi:MAG: di-heme oxidoredictase family protein, partial [Myxococcota bacterium]